MILLDGKSLTRDQVLAVALEEASIDVSPEALERVDASAAYVQSLVNEGRRVYGVTTGFGPNAAVDLKDAESAQHLQRNLILSHAMAVGAPLSTAVVRAMMVLRINTLLRGHSGIHSQTVMALVAMVNKGVHPIVPSKGSVGASGDLATLAHMALPLLGEGQAEHQGKILSGEEACRAAGIEPVELTYKEGLALTNGTQQICAHGILAVERLERLARVADLGAALAVEAKCGRSAAFDEDLHRLRPHPGQVASAGAIRQLLEGSALVDLDPEQKRDGDGNPAGSQSPQDGYSLRCAPAVHGAVRDSLAHAMAVLDIEMNSVTDNPLLFPEEDKVLSGGNFHGMPMAMALSGVKVAVAVLGSISERRLATLIDPALNDGLPAFLIDNQDGSRSGLMLCQYTAASLVNDLATRAHPAPVTNVPTSCGIEDQVSMGATEARHVEEMVDDVVQILALELLVAAQAITLRQRILAGAWPPKDQDGFDGSANATLGRGTAAAMDHLRSLVPERVDDGEMTGDVGAIAAAIQSGSLLAAVEAATGHLP